MPTQKDLKRLVRRRMQKTGESYTAARAQLLKSTASRNGATVSPAPKPRVETPRAEPDYAALAGMSDAAIRKGSGCTWKEWVGHLDYVGAQAWPHRKIAAHVQEKFGVRDWWAQGVTVGYERIRGLRAIGQRRDGAFEANKSRTFAAPVAAIYCAFTVARTRAKWLPGVKLILGKSTPNKYVRMKWADGSLVQIGLTAKGPQKSTAAVQHGKLADREAVTRTKEFWSERLDALAKLLDR